MIKIVKFIASLLLPFAAAAIGSLATIPNVSTWYAELAKPFFSPPNWVFSPVWTVLYLLMGTSLYLVWTARNKKPKKPALTMFGMQLILNVLWSLVFFGLHAPWAGVVIIVLLLCSIIATMRMFWQISRVASYLLVPYAAWVSFATVLNSAVAVLN
ncbi:MAG TPA: TspO/MBR family protein [Candidatus Saccharimonadales bacterium]|nr:TspO/MBR family protein [Candidatus Saccharimonadales bacterium]